MSAPRLFFWKKAETSVEPKARLTFRETCADSLPSSEGLYFGAKLRFVWEIPETLMENAPTLRSAAAAQVAEKAVRAVREHSVLRSEFAENTVNTQFWRDYPVAVNNLLIKSAELKLTVSSDVVEAAQRIVLAAAAQKMDRAERERARERVEFFRETVLRDPGTARLYLMLESAAIHGGMAAGNDIDALVTAVAAWNPANRWLTLTGVIKDFFDGQSQSAKAALLRDFREILTLHQRDDLVKRLSELDPGVESGPTGSA